MSVPYVSKYTRYSCIDHHFLEVTDLFIDVYDPFSYFEVKGEKNQSSNTNSLF